MATSLVEEPSRPEGPSRWENRCWATCTSRKDQLVVVHDVQHLGVYSTQGVV